MLTKNFARMRKNAVDRWAREGRKLEARVLSWLQELVRTGVLESARATETNGPEDAAGYDFVVRRNGVEKGFGVTHSNRCAGDSRLKHPGVVIWWIPFSMKPETLLRKVVDLFEAP